MTEYTTERGIAIQVVPIPLLLDKIRSSHPEPEPVTYTEHIAGGETQEVAITPAMAAAWQGRDPEGWKAHAEKWAAYQKAIDERSQVVNDAIWKAIMLKAIRVELPKDDGWIEVQRELGIDVPDSPRAHLEHYIWTEAIGGARDLIQITAIANGADLTEEALSAAEASFRDTLQRPSARRHPNP